MARGEPGPARTLVLAAMEQFRARGETVSEEIAEAEAVLATIPSR